MPIRDLIARGIGYGGIGRIVTGGLTPKAVSTIVEVLPNLIDKVDNVELVRDVVGAILFANSISQQALAIVAGKDPDLWKLRVFIERSNPWGEFRDDPADVSPIVNIWLSGGSYPQDVSNSVSKQGMTAAFNVDIYGTGKTESVLGGGQKPGDKKAAFEAQRAYRLVRNTLMSAQNIYLQLRGVVGQRWIESADIFQPVFGVETVEHVIGMRASLVVRLNEFSPQNEGVTLEQVFVDVVRAGDGFILAETDFDYTT